MSLVNLIRGKRVPNKLATATFATFATQNDGGGKTVASVATVAVANPLVHPANATFETNSDGWCWPYSQAMNAREIDIFTVRLARFTAKGVSYDDSERLADKLVLRDRESDDRRLCLECVHLQGHGRWRCGKWKLEHSFRNGLAHDLVMMLRRCGEFFSHCQEFTLVGDIQRLDKGEEKPPGQSKTCFIRADKEAMQSGLVIQKGKKDENH